MGLLHSTTWAPHFSRTIQGGGNGPINLPDFSRGYELEEEEEEERQKPTILREEEGRGGIFPSFSFLPWDKSRAVQRQKKSKKV